MSLPAQLIREINLGYTIVKVFNPISENNYLMIIYYDVLGNWSQKQIKTDKDKNIILFGNLAQIKKLLT
jgi:hypothetical protein